MGISSQKQMDCKFERSTLGEKPVAIANLATKLYLEFHYDA